ncbi:unnamed protein product [Parnassius apollo]|uniref:(apollo) hypothetical protein n=1 Tax=Parnassius apollo TaxID=110799 RepID=A0A8S3WQQ3_PARAO|nr:unnamed protein product [Parnassius apollo]
MILDEEKLVTYISLSKELCLHVNESKILLQKLIEDIRNKNPKIALNINYIISGITDKNVAKTTVCMETELSVIKKSFEAIFFEHIYSVSKGFSRVDNASLLTTNKFEDFTLCTGIIKCSECSKRTADEIGVLKSNSQNYVSIDNKIQNIPPKKIKNEISEKSDESGNNKEETKHNGIKLQENIKKERNSPKKEEICKTANKNNIKQKGIAGFFGKSNGVTIKKEIEKKPAQTENKEVKVESTTTEVKVEKISVAVESEQKKIKESDKVKNKQEAEKMTDKRSDVVEDKKIQKITKKNLKVDKKRKRVLRVSDSESDNETNDPFYSEKHMDLQNESEDEIPPTPSVNTIKITSGIVNPKKRRKIVDKTYTDEDGYILTRKEEVYESCSENDEEVTSKENVEHINKKVIETSPKEKKNGVKSSKKKVIQPQTGKQTTIMNFFNKSVN